MNNDKLRELWDDVKIQHQRFSQIVHDLITDYRQLEKDIERLQVLQGIDEDEVTKYAEANAELLEALKPYWYYVIKMSNGERERLLERTMIRSGDEDYIRAFEVYTKHSGGKE